MKSWVEQVRGLKGEMQGQDEQAAAKFSLVLPTISFFHVGNIIVTASLGAEVYESIATKIALLSKNPTPLEILDLERDGAVKRVALPDISSIEEPAALRFSHAEKMVLKDIIVISFIMGRMEGEDVDTYAYLATFADKMDDLVAAARQGKLVDIYKNNKVLIASTGEPGEIRLLYNLAYNFGEQTTNVTLTASEEATP